MKGKWCVQGLILFTQTRKQCVGLVVMTTIGKCVGHGSKPARSALVLFLFVFLLVGFLKLLIVFSVFEMSKACRRGRHSCSWQSVFLPEDYPTYPHNIMYATQFLTIQMKFKKQFNDNNRQNIKLLGVFAVYTSRTR